MKVMSLQVKFMKRLAESSDLASVLRKLPRIKRHLLNPENMRDTHTHTHTHTQAPLKITMMPKVFFRWPPEYLYTVYAFIDLFSHLRCFVECLSTRLGQRAVVIH